MFNKHYYKHTHITIDIVPAGYFGAKNDNFTILVVAQPAVEA